MAEESILTPGYSRTENIETVLETPMSTPLYKENYLREFYTEEEKKSVRNNLDVYSKDETIEEVKPVITKISSDIVSKYLSDNDLYGVKARITSELDSVVKADGSVPFVNVLTGVDPYLDEHLATLRSVKNAIKTHKNEVDPHNILPLVDDKLVNYRLKSESYSKSLLYNKTEINEMLSKYIKPTDDILFDIIPRIKDTPKTNSQLVNKKYVDSAILEHLIELDPHGLKSYFDLKLTNYTRKEDVYTKTLTYSKVQLDLQIATEVYKYVPLVVDTKLDEVNDKINKILNSGYVKLNGSVPFRNPLKGVNAEEDDELVTLELTKLLIDNVKTLIPTSLPESEWVTSGPIETTVGFLQTDDELPERMTLLEICDAIFYGKGISLIVPDYVTITEPCPITVCVHGSIGMIEFAELYQNGELLFSFSKEDFEDGCITVDSKPLTSDAEFTFKVYYTNGTIHEDTKVVHCYMPVFVGLLPKWKFGTNITMDYLIELSKQDIAGTQNKFLNLGKKLRMIKFKYEFKDPDLRKPFIVIPVDYPDLESMTTMSQSFGIEAFNIIDRMVLEVPGVEEPMPFKMYVYKEALSSLNQEVTFNFKPKE